LTIQTYLFFEGCCEDAIEFYGDVFGAEAAFLMRFKDGPPGLMFEGGEEKILHARVVFGDTTLDMADVRDPKSAGFSGFALIVHFDNIEEADRVFSELAFGGQITLALAPTFWAARYGIVRDRFGVTWKVQVS
jgi:PhnB protein